VPGILINAAHKEAVDLFRAVKIITGEQYIRQSSQDENNEDDNEDDNEVNLQVAVSLLVTRMVTLSFEM